MHFYKGQNISYTWLAGRYFVFKISKNIHFVKVHFSICKRMQLQYFFQQKRKSKQNSRKASDILSKLLYLHVSLPMSGYFRDAILVAHTDVNWNTLTSSVHKYISLMGGNEDISCGEALLWGCRVQISSCKQYLMFSMF